MNSFIATNIAFVVMIIILIGIVLLILNKSKNLASMYFVWFVLSVVVWIFTNLMANLSITSGGGLYLFWSRATLIGPTIMPLFMLLFADTFQSNHKPLLNKYIFWALCLVCALIILLVPTSLNIESVKIIDAKNYLTSFTPGPLYSIFSVYLSASVLLSVSILVIRYRQSTKLQKYQIKAVLYGVLTTAILGLIAGAVMPLFGVNLFVNDTPLTVVLFIGFTTYAIMAHHLFDIRVIIKRTVVYSALLGFILVTYAVVVMSFSQIFGGETASLSYKALLPNLIAAVLIATGFEPLRRWLQRVTDKYLFKGEYDPQDVARKLASMLTAAVSLDEALDFMMSVLTHEMRISRAATVVVRKIEGHMSVSRIKSIGYSNVIKLGEKPVGLLLRYFARHPQVVVVDELRDTVTSSPRHREDDEHLLKQLDQFQTAVALPILVSGQIIGILIVGEKLSGDRFTQSDLDTLSLIGSQTAVSIEKAKFYEEDKLKTEFISIASHELLTPTAAIEGYLSMLLEDDLKIPPKQQKDYITRAYDSSRHMADLVKDLLSISRIESGRIKVAAVPMDLNAVVKKTIDELSQLAAKKGLALNYPSPKSALPKVMADPERVQQVCTNLINNAIKYTPQGKVTIEVHSAGKKVWVSVADTGMGMAKSEIPHLFEKFHRLPEAVSAGIGGTGLGLYITKNIVTLLGGEIKVESEVGKGSTFSFSLPVAT